MAYSTINDILSEMSQSELARLTGDPQGEEINEERVNSAIFYADTLIDASLIGRYDVPFEGDVDPLISKISLDLSLGNLYEFAYSKTAIPLTIYKRKQNAMDLLKELQHGKVNLLTSAPGTSSPPLIVSNKSKVKRIFDDDKLNIFSDI